MRLMNFKRLIISFAMFVMGVCQIVASPVTDSVECQFSNGKLILYPLLDNAVRVKYIEEKQPSLPELIYVERDSKKINYEWKDGKSKAELVTLDMVVKVDKKKELVQAYNNQGELVFKAYAHTLQGSSVADIETNIATMSWHSPQDEHIYGLGQFQDGYGNIRGLSRRLTQVNTQISNPMLISDKGYGLLWNNYGMTEFNPLPNQTKLIHNGIDGVKQEVSVSREGQEIVIREEGAFEGEIEVPCDGSYSILLDAGQKMASAHNLEIDGEVIIDIHNPWLPPTLSAIVDLKAGKHKVVAKLERWDNPTLYYNLIQDNSTFSSPVAECVDYTIFVGNADKVIKAYRELTGEAKLLPMWAMGYTHCRERYKTQDELLENAKIFRQKQIPLDLIVQDWQYWGRYGWNSMVFDESAYPDPAKMVQEIHDMNMKIMLSVWSKIDEGCEVGQEMKKNGYYIDGSTWIDFFNPKAAECYWNNMSKRLLQPYKIDAWWQDATEPENDDLVGRRLNNGTVPGEVYRNMYPMMVSKTVYEGLRKDDPNRRPMIFTRSAYTGAQRYAAVVWSGDIGWDCEVLRRQIMSGLGIASSGLTWWTYDAGGFFRVNDQYTNQEYIETMLRWIQTSTFLPLMRVHGYASDTEPWRYGEQAEKIITDYIKLRYKLLPYIYSEAARVTFDGHTILRPLIFDFASDKEALKNELQFMCGSSILVNPVIALNVSTWKTYLPVNEDGWYDYWSGKYYDGGQYVDMPVNIEMMPVFIKGGSIMTYGPDKQYSKQSTTEPMNIVIYPGKDAEFTLYEDDGTSNAYEEGSYTAIELRWDQDKQEFKISQRHGHFSGFMRSREFVITCGDNSQTVRYIGDEITVNF